MNLTDLLDWAEQMKNQQTLDSVYRGANFGSRNGVEKVFPWMFSGYSFPPLIGAEAGDGAIWRTQNSAPDWGPENIGAQAGKMAKLRANNEAYDGPTALEAWKQSVSNPQAPQMGSNAPARANLQSILNALIR